MTPEREQKLKKVIGCRQENLTVVMENVFDPHNVSAVMRTCDAVGIQEIYILNTKIPLPKKWGSKSSSSAAKWLTIHSFTRIEDCMNALRGRFQQILTTHLGENAKSLYEIDFTGSMALVFGNEHEGVSEEMTKLADGNFIIPQVGIIQSLNISVACAVSLYEAYRQKEIAGHYRQAHADETYQKNLMQEWGIG